MNKELIEARKQLVVEGLLEHAKDSEGKPMYRNGQPVWRITEKGIAAYELEKAESNNANN
jgi:hypothetical protein